MSILSFNDAKKIIDYEEHLIVDVREESELIETGIIKNAIHIPLSSIENFFINLQTSNTNINSDTYILIYCAVGIRSGIAAERLKIKGFSNVFWVQEGWGGTPGNPGEPTRIAFFFILERFIKIRCS